VQKSVVTLNWKHRQLLGGKHWYAM